MRSILLTWDIEEFDAPEDFGAPRKPDGGLSRGGSIWENWLVYAQKWNVPATCFVTGRMAEAFPALLADSRATAHEIASHGWTHERGADLRLKESREKLASLAGCLIQGFRSPRLRHVPTSDISEAGYQYDASSNPALVPGRYCRWRENRLPHRRGNLWEVPASVLPLIRFPLFWATFHILPLPLYQAACRMVLATDGLLTLYFHPWELSDLNEPKLPRWLRKRPKAQRVERMVRLIRWLGTIGTFRTISDYLAGIRVTRP
jgi:peptidoglycan/xylan/chitin deacetylase (PgdA/CDA1 family)